MRALPSRFYGIVDEAGARDPVELARLMLEGGARLLQLRLKRAGGRALLEAARAVAELCRARGATFIVNDRADIAMLSGADGVHLGQDDLPLEAARRILGPDRIIGVSTHALDEARAAELGGADYVGFGPVYPGGLKRNAAGKGLDELRAVGRALRIPVVAIGGITEATIPEVLAAGAAAAALISDVVGAADVRAKVRALLELADSGVAARAAGGA